MTQNIEHTFITIALTGHKVQKLFEIWSRYWRRRPHFNVIAACRRKAVGEQPACLVKNRVK
jgi:hypothetical protein